MKVALSKASGKAPYLNYIPWLKKAEDDIECIDMSGRTVAEALELLDGCSGLVLTGGPDVEPKHYNRPNAEGLGTVDAARDELEFALFRRARERSMPVLGICRGLQLINVALGGTLYVDLPSESPSDVEHGQREGVDAEHHVMVEPGTLLMKVSGVTEGEVNSAHHQAIEDLAEGLLRSAESPDGNVEAIEWRDGGHNGFLAAVQWHPERMDYSHPLSGHLAERFLFEAYSYKLLMMGDD